MENWMWILGVVALYFLLFRKGGAGCGSSSPAGQDQKQQKGESRQPLITGGNPDGKSRQIYCPMCGRDADWGIRRMNEYFCSETHAEEFVREVEARQHTGGEK